MKTKTNLGSGPVTKDGRSPLAVARDDFLDSAAGKKLWDAETLKAPRDQWYYLKNRIEHAFLEGVKVGARLEKERRRK